MFENTPHIISSWNKTEPYDNIPIYTGLVELIAADLTCLIDGEINFIGSRVLARGSQAL